MVRSLHIALARRVEAGLAEDTPEQLKNSPALRALYNNLKGVPRTLQHSVKDMDLALGNPQYYCLSSFIDSEWLWRASLPEPDLNVLADTLGLHPMPLDQVGDAFRNMPPYWWQPILSNEVRILATANFPMADRGSDGWHALATWNPEDEILHMWIKDNF